MALPSLNLCHLHSPIPRSHLALPHPQNPNPNTNSSSFFLSIHSFPSRQKLATSPLLSPIRCSTSGAHGGHADYENTTVVHPRPSEIPWSKELANSVRLIGTVGAPIQIKHLTSGKVLAWTRLAVWKSATDTTWINLTFWDDLAQIAYQHVEKGQQVYVSGRLVSDVVGGEDDEKQQVYYKVVVQQLNFVERSIPQVSLYDPGTNSVASDEKMGKYMGSHGSGGGGGSTEELWQAFFANPVDWWDNRNNKRNPKAPDFKHKDTGEALWIEGKYNPPWVKSQLSILDTRMGSSRPSGARPAVSFMYGDELGPF